jgi:hypothetical protein
MANTPFKLIFHDETIGIDFSIPSEVITEIEFHNVHFVTYPTLPQHITKLTFERCQFPGEDPVQFHEGLHTLRLGLQPAFAMVFPSSLHSLSIRKMRFPTFPALPENLKELRLIRVGSPVPVEFPGSLLKLTIIECYWRTLPPFPSQLQVLLLDELVLDTLPPIPPSVLHYQECEVDVLDRSNNNNESSTG